MLGIGRHLAAFSEHVGVYESEFDKEPDIGGTLILGYINFSNARPIRLSLHHNINQPFRPLIRRTKRVSVAYLYAKNASDGG